MAGDHLMSMDTQWHHQQTVLRRKYRFVMLEQIDCPIAMTICVILKTSLYGPKQPLDRSEEF